MEFFDPINVYLDACTVFLGHLERKTKKFHFVNSYIFCSRDLMYFQKHDQNW